MIFFKLIFLILFLSSCAHKEVALPLPPPSEIQKREVPISAPIVDTQEVDVIYTTNRERMTEQGGCTEKDFSIKPGQTVSYGLCKINTPKLHPVGSIDSNMDSSADPHSYFLPTQHFSMTEEQTKDFFKQAGPSGILVFVHGFNVRFTDAVNRAAQIAYDLKFPGRVVLFSWPAGSANGLISSALVNVTYELNRRAAAESVEIFRNFLKMISESTDQPIYLVVHSMGHQVVLPALKLAYQDIQKPMIKELILNAPDFDAKQFDDIAEDLKKISSHITLYCSVHDRAMDASERVNKTKRLGACHKFSGIDVVNVSDIDSPGLLGLGHGYYSSRPILTDVFQILMGIEPERRLFIRKSDKSELENWFLRP